ncbi:MAG: response regulator transcription factor [Elusimicrobiota bacterium]|nr:response regulator transcription factor [Elusimicrobiota bacterium]
MEQKQIKVFLVDDHPIVREGVHAYLTSHSIAVVGAASDAPEALRKIKKLAPDVIVLDVNLPSMHGWELARLLHRLVPESKILAFSLHSSEEYVVKMARCGARGYVTKDQPTSELLKAIKRVFQGGLQFPVGTSAALFSPSVKVYKRPASPGPKNKKHKPAP